MIDVFIWVELLSTRMSSWLRGSWIKFFRSYLVLLVIIFVLTVFLSKSISIKLSPLLRWWWKWATTFRRTRWFSVFIFSSKARISSIKIWTRRWSSRLSRGKATLPPLMMLVGFRFLTSVLLMFWWWWSWPWPWNCADLESFSWPALSLFYWFLMMVYLTAAVVSWRRSSWSWASLKLRRSFWPFSKLTFLDLRVRVHKMIGLMMIFLSWSWVLIVGELGVEICTRLLCLLFLKLVERLSVFVFWKCLFHWWRTRSFSGSSQLREV